MAAVIAGCGSATGSALARRFAKQGLKVYGGRRRPPSGVPEPSEFSLAAVDFRDEGAVQDFVASIEEPIEVAVHNIGGNVRFPVCETTPRVYRKVWEMCALSAFHFSRAVAPGMVERGRGTLLFTGATASLRGGAGFCAFAGAMAAKRQLAQSLAREIGPAGVHVAHVVVDGGIDTTYVRQLLGEDAYADLKARDGLLDPDAIADAYWAIHEQKRTAWTHELDLRPYRETF